MQEFELSVTFSSAVMIHQITNIMKVRIDTMCNITMYFNDYENYYKEGIYFCFNHMRTVANICIIKGTF